MPITRRVMIAAAATAALPTAAVAKAEVHDVGALQNAFNLLHDVVFRSCGDRRPRRQGDGRTPGAGLSGDRARVRDGARALINHSLVERAARPFLAAIVIQETYRGGSYGGQCS